METPPRALHLLLGLAALALPAAAAPKSWQGIHPGQSTRADVIARFGDPSTHGKLGERLALVYKGDQALAGTRQAQFFTRDDGLVVEITVFPATALDKDSVEGTYGKGAQKSFTDDFRPVWIYKAAGITVFFGKEGAVEAISFKPGEGAAREPAPAPPRGAAPAPRPATAAPPAQ
ncbi:MAG: hypothetical protein HZB56_19955 [Deltaproteobacteria bacterium]|nr:hypothetical protein [Deltaproteobacteria bacterium]